jgi:hypothetical protein
VADSKHEETFKVIDRRHFTEEGNLRPEAVELERREEEAAAKEAAAKKAANASKPAASAQANPTTKSGANPSAQSASSSAAKSAIADAEAAYSAQDKPPSTLIAPGDASPDASDSLTGEQSQSSRSFQMLVDFLTRNAAAMLGGMADPRTGQPFVDLEGAREVIDMLDALREKAKGK